MEVHRGVQTKKGQFWGMGRHQCFYKKNCKLAMHKPWRGTGDPLELLQQCGPEAASQTQYWKRSLVWV